MTRPLRVLLVEDDHEDAQIFQKRCPAHFRVKHVSDPDLAIESMRSGSIDLCFSDYRLGPSSGIDLVRAARARACRLPIVIITGADVDHLGENALLAGATDFLPKDELSAESLSRVARWALIRRHVETQREDAVSDALIEQLMGRGPSDAVTDRTPRELRRVLYLSRATSPLSSNDLLLMCSGFASRNASMAVTGILVYAAGRFLQVIEGDPDAIGVLVDRISGDRRHGEMMVVIDEHVKARLFAQWNMGLLQIGDRGEVTPEQWRAMPGAIRVVIGAVGDAVMSRENAAKLLRALPGLLARDRAGAVLD